MNILGATAVELVAQYELGKSCWVSLVFENPMQIFPPTLGSWMDQNSKGAWGVLSFLPTLPDALPLQSSVPVAGLHPCLLALGAERDMTECDAAAVGSHRKFGRFSLLFISSSYSFLGPFCAEWLQKYIANFQYSQ